MRSIEEAVAQVEKGSTGRYRFRLLFEGIYFHSAPQDKGAFIALWETMVGRPELSAVQYESRTEYTPGHYVWQTF